MSQDHGIGQLLALVAMLRDPREGCPWDKEQTFASTVSHTLEEAYEVADAVEKNDMTLLKEELGDLLLQIVFYAQMAEEHRFFSFADVTACLTDKLVRRHPHVFGKFGNIRVSTADEQLVVWNALKEEEKRQRKTKPQSSALDGLATTLLTRAQKLSILLKKAGIECLSTPERVSTINIQSTALRTSVTAQGSRESLVEGLGDLLFTCVRLADQLKINPEIALSKANDKYKHRLTPHGAEPPKGSEGEEREARQPSGGWTP